jgi:hypothetical protein
VLPSLFGKRYCCVLTAVATLAAASSYAVSRVGEKVGEVPAPASMIVPEAGMFVFHSRLNTYVSPAVIGYTVCT